MFHDLSKFEKSLVCALCLCSRLVKLIKGNNLQSISCIKMADKQKVDLGLLEEDDEFEEFPTEHWGTEDADDADVSVWEDNWEDDVVQDDFSQQLRQQLEKLREQNKS